MEWLDTPSKWSYRGEGNATLVILNAEHQQVLRLKKVLPNSKREASNETNIEAPKWELVRSINFCQDVFLPLLGEKYVHPGTVVQLPENFITGIQSLVSLGSTDRPVHRRTKEVNSQCKFGVLVPDFCYVSGEGQTNQTTPTICVEIKPKCGVLPKCNKATSTCDTHEKVKQSICKYCLIQWLKVNKQEKYNRRSSYCPLDLFSNDPKRVFHALSCLFQDPQNNLKIFRDGKMIYGGEANVPSAGSERPLIGCPPSSSWLPSGCPISQHANQSAHDNHTTSDKNKHPLATGHSPSGNHLPPTGHPVNQALSGNDTIPDIDGEPEKQLENLEDMLSTIFTANTPTTLESDGTLSYTLTTTLQLFLLQLLVDDSKNSTTSTGIDTVTTTPVCTESSYKPSLSNQNISTFLKSQTFGKDGVLNKILGAQSLDKLGSDKVYELYQLLTKNPDWVKNLGIYKFNVISEDCNSLKNGFTTKSIPFDYFYGKNLTEQKRSETSIENKDSFSSSLVDIARFLVAASANDCSIMISFQQVDSVPMQNVEQTPCYIKDALTGLSFKYSIAVVDLDPKNIDRVPKYYHEYHDIIENFLQYANN